MQGRERRNALPQLYLPRLYRGLHMGGATAQAMITFDAMLHVDLTRADLERADLERHLCGGRSDVRGDAPRVPGR